MDPTPIDNYLAFIKYRFSSIFVSLPPSPIIIIQELYMHFVLIVLDKKQQFPICGVEIFSKSRVGLPIYGVVNFSLVGLIWFNTIPTQSHKVGIRLVGINFSRFNILYWSKKCIFISRNYLNLGRGLIF